MRNTSQCKWKNTDHRSILYRTLFVHFGRQEPTKKPNFLIKGTAEYTKFLSIVEVLTPLFGGDPYPVKVNAALRMVPSKCKLNLHLNLLI